MKRADRSLVVFLVTAAVAVLPLLVSAPATAAVGSHSPGDDPCLTDGAHGQATRTADRNVPGWRKGIDTSRVTQQDVQALTARESRPGFVAREVAPRLPATVRIPVYAHVIKGKHRGERPRLRPKRIRNMIAIMNNAMSARQNSAGARARYQFVLKKVTTRRNDAWFHAAPNSARERKMRRKLHRGNARSLNLYLGGTGSRVTPLLGWARFPWQYAGAPKQDGVAVSINAIPGGRARGYNGGDTLVHETGHWLGLFHTFQGGCSESGDLVSDTPAEAEPSYYCQVGRDSCLESPGADPVRNFMNFSLDSCMNMFTPGQVLRMDSAFEKYRY